MDPRVGGAEARYTYRAGPELAVGDGVIVPLGNRSILGFVVAIYEATEADLGFPVESLRDVTDRIRGLTLPPTLVSLAGFVADEYLCGVPTALSPATPPGILDRLVTVWTRTTRQVDGSLTPAQAEALRTIEEAEGGLRETKTKPIPAGAKRALKLLRAKELVEVSLQVAPPSERRKSDALLRLNPDADRVERFLTEEGRRKPAQALTLMCMQGAEQAALAPTEIKAMAGVTDATLKSLVEVGLLQKVEGELEIPSTPPTPNRFQKLALDAVTDRVQAGEHRTFLLFGVTGSGKTEVYLRCAAEALRMGRQVLYLVPEIALAAQAIAQLRDRFGRQVAVLHSEQTPVERLQNWLRIRNGEAPVVLGPRSALFAPLDRLGLIVMDEEHEASYKQESAPRYHAKRLVRKLGELHGCPVLLGSATPSVESYWEAERDEITLLSLPARAASAQLPSVEVSDLSIGFRMGRPAIFTDALQERMKAALEKGEQAILFLNRRAYAQFLICRSCGAQITCPNCAVSLSFHRHEGRLRCHHCGYRANPPETCPSCGGTRIAPIGIGTEKVEEAVVAQFPDHTVGRLDRDVARKKGALEEALAEFRSGDMRVLVGTQMVAKGLDFPNVTVVGVIAADVSLNLPDFRASERTYQLLSQVAGRAGRGERHGNVVIQTFNPEHPAVRAATTHDFPAFYEVLRAEREMAKYPPYVRLVNILLTGENRKAVNELSTAIGERLRQESDLTVLGPVDCVLERIQNRWRRHLLIKLPLGVPPTRVRDALLGIADRQVQVVLDVDPYSLM